MQKNIAQFVRVEAFETKGPQKEIQHESFFMDSASSVWAFPINTIGHN